MEQIEAHIDKSAAQIDYLKVKLSNEAQDCMYIGILGIIREIFNLIDFPAKLIKKKPQGE
ncbi:hypothetical protein D0T66_14615 [Dysgonomonas sp. 25]|nr:hypothetical protein [Dysgonomonas sp. 25]